MSGPIKGATHYHAQLGYQTKVVQLNGWLSAIVRMFVPLNLLSGLPPSVVINHLLWYEWYGSIAPTPTVSIA